MNYRALWVAFALGSSSCALYAQEAADADFTVSEIKVEGLQRISQGTVFNYLPVNIYGTGNITEVQRNNQNRGTLKLDHKLTNKDQLMFTYSIDNDIFADNLGGGDSTPGPAYNQVGGAQIFGARWTHTFNPSFLNEFRAGYLRHVSNFAAPGTTGIASQYTADNLSTGFGATAGFPQLFTENQFSYEDAATITHRAHTMKYGFRFMRTRNGSSFYNDVNGSLAFWGAPGILTDAFNEVDGLRILDGGATTGPYESAYGTLYYASASQDPSTGLAPDPYRGYRANEFSAYAQDDWKATPHLTLNYGVRWDYFGPPHNFRSGVDSNVYFGTATTVTTTNPFAPGTALYLGEQSSSFRCVGYNPCGSLTAPTSAGYALASGTSTIWDRDLNNFAPRLGFSYDTMGNGKLVLRGGFGVGYDRLYNNVYENIRFNGPHFVDNTAGYGYGAPGIGETLRGSLVQTPFIGNSALSGASPVPRHVNQHLKTAYYEQMHFGVETSLLKNYVIEANYIGTLGRQLVGIENANTFEGRVACSGTTLAAACTKAGLTTAQQSTARPSANYGNDNFRTNGFSSNYSSGQVSLRRSFSTGIQIMANYAYSKAMDEVSDVFTIKAGGTGIKTPYYPGHSYGPADFDVRHNAVFTVNYISKSATHKLLLAGWGLSPIVTAHSGTPIYVYDSASTYDPNKDGTTGVEKAIYVGPGSIKNAINHSVSPSAAQLTKANFKAYTCPANVNSGLWCDVPGDRQELYGLRYYNWDMAVSKHIALTERFNLTLQAAFFNTDGHVQWSNPVGDINSSNFGHSLSTGIRQGQLAGRIDF